jgi:hypothetical protein
MLMNFSVSLLCIECRDSSLYTGKSLARNIPHNMRDKMRSLDTNIKADFIQKDRTENITMVNKPAASRTRFLDPWS